MLSGQYWIFPTYSAAYTDQTFFDAFSSKDLVIWSKHERVLDNQIIKWARQAMWAPSVVEKEGKYYFFFKQINIEKKCKRSPKVILMFSSGGNNV